MPMSAAPGSGRPREELRPWLRGVLARLLGRDADEIGDDDRFARLGLDSLRTTALAGELSGAVGEPVPPALIWAYPTIDDLVRYFGRQPDAREAPAERPVRRGAPDEPVAVVGLACRFPGANSLDEFWALLRAGTDAIGHVPADRWTPDPGPAGGRVPTEAGFLSQPVYASDPLFFGISPREAAEMDPQQLLFLEVAWEALQDAGLANGALEGSRTGVFAGTIWHDYADLHGADAERLSQHSATGQALNMVANRLSYVLGLRGPSVTLDSACSSSLLAVHLACQSLRSGESDLALAGGVNLLLSEATMVSLTRFGGLSPDGRCKAFDARADGFGRGEGCGVAVLKRLSRALADGDPIWCVIRGSAANNDGPSNGLTAPNPLAQQDVLRQAYQRAGVRPADVQVVETHGTGTALGDPIEAAALGAVLGPGRPAGTPLVIGSVKTNIGHLEGAAGIAGIIKMALCLRHGAVPPTVHFGQPSPHIDFGALRLRVPVANEPWPAGGPRLAGVSSFGWGGTNVHVVLAGWTEPEPLPEIPVPDAAAGGTAGATPGTTPGHPRVAFVCSPHGHQWVGMARRMLRTEPVFRAVIERCDKELARHAGWSLLDELFADEDAVRYDDVSVTQPILFAVEVALAAWLEARGVPPDAVTGHSLGEISAAVIAGFLDIPEAVRLVHLYSRQQQRIAGLGGGMAVAELAPAELQALLRPSGGGDPARVVIAGQNGPRSTVLAGGIPALERLLAELKARGVLCAMIKVSVAAHSAAIDAITPDLIAEIGELAVTPGRIPMISTVTGDRVHADDLDAGYFARNLREPVRLADATAELLASGYGVLVELSANPVLLTALQQSARDAAGGATVLTTMARGDDDRAGVWDALCELGKLGAIRRPQPETAGSAELFTLSAMTVPALRAAAAETARRIDELPPTPVADLAAAANRRADHPYRLAAVAGTRAGLADALRGHADGEPVVGLRASARPAGRPKVVFVFPGQGAQWAGMGRELLASEGVFRAAIRECADAVSRYVDWSVLDELGAGPAASHLDRIDVVQPMLFAMEVALAKLWESWGVRPDAVVGHSMGEVAAAYTAGAISLDDAARVICLRSWLMRRASGQGAMLATELTTAEAALAIGERQDLVSVAVSNSRRSTVLSGDREALDAIAAELGRREVFCRWVKVDVASHSPQMDGLRGELSRLLAGVSGRAPAVPMHSTVTGALLRGTDLDAGYWNRNLRMPVLFGDQVSNLVQDGHTVFIEASPHPILLPAVQQVAMDHDATGVTALPSLRRGQPARETLLDSLGALYLLGAPVDRRRAARPGRRAALLPAYPWQRQDYRPDGAGRQRARPRPGSLLGERLDSAIEPGTHYWPSRLNPDTAAIRDYRVGGAAAVPAGAYLDLALRAAREVLGAPGSAPATVTGLRVYQPLLAVAPERRTQVTLTRDEPTESARVRIFDEGPALLAEARVSVRPPAGVPEIADVAAIERRLAADGMPGDELYARLAERGLRCGPAYRHLLRVGQAGLETFARLAPPAPGGQAGDDLSPRLALLDAAIVAASAPALDPAAGAGTALIVAAIERVVVRPPLDAGGYARAVLRPAGDAFLADVTVYGPSGEPLAQATGVTLLRLAHPAATAPTARPGAGDPDESRGAGPIPGRPRDSFRDLPSGEERRTAIEVLTRECVATVARIPIGGIDLDARLRSFGVDSLMALELRSSLEARLGVALPSKIILNNPTVRELVPLVADCVGIPLR